MNIKRMTKHPWVLEASKNIPKGGVKNIRTFFNKEIALYRGEDSILSCVSNICPHRGAKMALGKVKGNCLACPYHGWLFDSKGKLVDVPSIDSQTTPQGSDLESLSFKVIEDNGFVWAVPNSYEHRLPSSLCPEFNMPGWNKVYGSREVKGWWRDWIDNALDVSHINYVHDFGDENNGVVSNMKIMNTEYSVICEVGVNPKATSVLTETMQPDDNAPVNSEFIIPNTSIIKIRLKDPYEFVTVTSVLPIDETTSRLSWCFLYNIDIPLFKDFAKWRFDKEMFKTVSEDEQIISTLVQKNESEKRINVPCDAFQVQAVKRLNKLLSEDI